MPWLFLESLPGLVALESVWQEKLADRFDAFDALCLERVSNPIQSLRCPRCGCNHEVVLRQDSAGAVAVCRCRPPACPDIPLSLQNITTLEVNRARLAHAICKAFGFAGRLAKLLSPMTFQVGSWSAAAVPVILTIQVQGSVFRRVVAELVATLRRSFILLGPTSDFLDAPAQSILENHGAAYFALSEHAVLKPHGTLQPTRAPGEIFARFTPQPNRGDADLDVATRAFALVRSLDTDKPLAHPSLLTVFRLYCIDELSAGRIARKCDCSKPTVLRRLALISARTGVNPADLRRLSPHIARLEEGLNDSRAKRPNRRAHLEEGEGEGED